jgi:hypothetical protein
MVAYETNGGPRNGHPGTKFVVHHTITAEGSVSGKVLRAFEPDPDRARLSFGD